MKVFGKISESRKYLSGKAYGISGKFKLERLKSSLNSGSKKKTAIALAVVLLLVAMSLFVPSKIRFPDEDISLPSNYIIFIESPEDSVDGMFITMLSPLQVRNNRFFPMILLEGGEITGQQLNTLKNMRLGNWVGIIFSNDSSIESKISSQVGGSHKFVTYPKCFLTLHRFSGFDGKITVSSYSEAIWASPIASIMNKKLVLGKATFESQEHAWSTLDRIAHVNYVVMTNTDDFNEIDQFHIKGHSAMAGVIAAYRGAFVITDAPLIKTPLSPGMDIEHEMNERARGYHAVLRNVYNTYPSIEYVAIVGSGSAVPQFLLHDRTGWEMSGVVTSDSVYGFLDDDHTTMDIALGRFISSDVTGVANLITRTYLFEHYIDTVKVKYSDGTVMDINWRTHGVAWNGYEVADKRMQLTPGYFIINDFHDEGFTADYMRTTGKGGWVSDNAWGETDLQTIMQSSMLMSYRGHGSATSTFIVRSTDENGRKIRVDWYDVREYELPPQILMSASCLNGKIWGMYRENDIKIEHAFATNFIYGGGIGLFASTEVSYSRWFQDFYALKGEITGDHDWDKNNYMYATFMDALLNHEREYGSLGKAGQWAINRYIRNTGYSVSPLWNKGDDIDWKQVSMYLVFGDPAFRPPAPRPGANNYDPWHNGPSDDAPEGININYHIMQNGVISQIFFVDEYTDIRTHLDGAAVVIGIGKTGVELPDYAAGFVLQKIQSSKSIEIFSENSIIMEILRTSTGISDITSSPVTINIVIR